MMSNSSDSAASLLAGMAAEWRLLAADIARLAETACNVTAPDAQTLVKLQAFDSLSQNVEAQARLLQALAGDCDRSRLQALLEDHPLPGVRARLKASLGLAAAPPDEAGAVHLFLEEP
jgi:hypothetical protein